MFELTQCNCGRTFRPECPGDDLCYRCRTGDVSSDYEDLPCPCDGCKARREPTPSGLVAVCCDTHGTCWGHDDPSE